MSSSIQQITIAYGRIWSEWEYHDNKKLWPYVEKAKRVRRPHLQHRLVCCDCGLAHDLEFVIVDKRKPHSSAFVAPHYYGLQYRVRRNERSTARVRHSYLNRGEMAKLAGKGSAKKRPKKAKR